jgi:hypothetical protein
MRREVLPLLLGLGVILAGCPKKSPSSMGDDPEEVASDQDRGPDDEEPDFDDLDSPDPEDALDEEVSRSRDDAYDLDEEPIEE